jgi:hypothetical protein
MPIRRFTSAALGLILRQERCRTEFGHLISHSYTDHGGWYVMIFPMAYQMEYSTGLQTTYFSPWSYDRHVPLGFFGEEF